MKKRYVYLVVTDNQDYLETVTTQEIFSSYKKAKEYVEKYMPWAIIEKWDVL